MSFIHRNMRYWAMQKFFQLLCNLQCLSVLNFFISVVVYQILKTFKIVYFCHLRYEGYPL